MTVTLERPFDARELRSLRSHGHIDTLVLIEPPVFTAKTAKGLSEVVSVRCLYLGCPTTRTSMRHVVPVPGLEVLHIRSLRHPGVLENFSEASALKVFFCDSWMTEDDIVEVSRIPNLEQLSADTATISKKALDAILRIPKLRKLSLEDTELNDLMAAAIASSKTIESLDVGDTLITATGLGSICTMSQLRSLDIWAIDIEEEDLDMLRDLPNLEYLSIGGHERQTKLTSKGVLPRLTALPSLRRVWLDGIVLSDSEMAALEKRFDYVRAY